jgi:flagellar biosynthesis GTPase FlhF
MPGDAPVLILTGPPGVGKTTAAAALAARFPRAVAILRVPLLARRLEDGHPVV